MVFSLLFHLVAHEYSLTISKMNANSNDYVKNTIPESLFQLTGDNLKQLLPYLDNTFIFDTIYNYSENFDSDPTLSQYFMDMGIDSKILNPHHGHNQQYEQQYRMELRQRMIFYKCNLSDFLSLLLSLYNVTYCKYIKDEFDDFVSILIQHVDLSRVHKYLERRNAPNRPIGCNPNATEYVIIKQQLNTVWYIFLLILNRKLPKYQIFYV